MRVTRVDFDPASFGITARSLRILRDALAVSFSRKLLVVQVPVESICCGFFVFDFAAMRAMWTGDGFRTDGGGEGGAGFRSAEALLRLFGMQAWTVDKVDFTTLYALRDSALQEAWLRNLAQKIMDESAFTNDEFKCPRERQPGYLR